MSENNNNNTQKDENFQGDSSFLFKSNIKDIYARLHHPKPTQKLNRSPEEVQAIWEKINYQLAEVIAKDEILNVLKERDLSIYWGTATTGRPHLGYFVPMYKIADLLNAGCNVTILFADLHAFLDNMKSPLEQLHARCEWYEYIIKEMLKTINVPLERLKFVRGSSFQFTQEYTFDIYRLCAKSTTWDTTRGGAEVVKQTKNPLMSSLLYPLLQALDEEYLGVDVQFGGLDQRKIFMLAREKLPYLGYKQRAYIMNPLIPGLGKPEEGKDAKMSASDPLSKVDFDEDEKTIDMKFRRAFSVDGIAENNGCLAILKYVIYRKIDFEKRQFIVDRPEKWGGKMVFNNYQEVEDAFVKKELVSDDLKKAIAKEIKLLFAPLREAVERNRDLHDRAYPEYAKQKPEKKAKGPAPPTPANLQVKVGKITSVADHDKMDNFYILTVDIGEEKPRTICSAFKKTIDSQNLLNQLVPIVTNTPPHDFKGVLSSGLVLLCTKDTTSSSLIKLDSNAKIGDDVLFSGFKPEPENPLSKKRWEKISASFLVDEQGQLGYQPKGEKFAVFTVNNTPLTGQVGAKIAF